LQLLAGYDKLKLLIKNTKNMRQKKKKDQRFSFVRRLMKKPAFAVSGALVAACLVAAPLVAAQSIQQQIDNLNAQNSQTQSSVSSLQAQAGSYQDAINQLQSQIASLQAAIAGNQAQEANLQQRIQANQAELDHQKQILGSDIKAMYVDGQMSTVEELATSKNLSDFVDAATYRGAVQGEVQKTLDQISQLENQLTDQKNQVDGLLKAQQAQNDQLNAAENQQNQLLAMNQSQQATYNSQIQANNTQIAKLQAQQVAQNRALGASVHEGGTGSYPWADTPCPYGSSGGTSCGSYDWGYPGNPYDPLGWQYRNCTSYAFWRLDQTRGIALSAGYFPNVLNSPNQGIGYSIPDFRNLGYAVDHNPQGATLAVEGAGSYGNGIFGHIMYVESSTSASASVSQYNWYGDGQYSTMTITPSSPIPNVWFVHIP
jgi:peptidoglycan hydrolase CwlO-like protein